MHFPFDDLVPTGSRFMRVRRSVDLALTCGKLRSTVPGREREATSHPLSGGAIGHRRSWAATLRKGRLVIRRISGLPLVHDGRGVPGHSVAALPIGRGLTVPVPISAVLGASYAVEAAR